MERGDWDGVASALADDFRNERERQDRKAFVAWLRSAWSAFGQPAPRATVREAAVQGDLAAVRVRVTAAGFPPIDARIECVRTPDGWRVLRVVEHSAGSFVR